MNQGMGATRNGRVTTRYSPRIVRHARSKRGAKLPMLHL